MMKHTISNVKGTIKYNVLIPTFIKSVTINIILTVFLELGLPRLKNSQSTFIMSSHWSSVIMSG